MNIGRILIATLATLAVAGVVMKLSTPGAPPDVKTAGAKTVAIVHFASWCSSCRVLEPKLAKVRGEAEKMGVEWITLDFTNPKDSAAQVEKAKKAGLEKHVSEGGTGYAVVVSKATGKEVARINQDDSEAVIRQKLAAVP